MRYSNAWQIIAMTVIWAVALIVFKKVTDRPEEMMARTFEKPEIRLFVQHVGCEQTRQNELTQALQSLPWLGTAVVQKRTDIEKPEKPSPEIGRPVEMPDACTVRVDAPVTQVDQVDVMQVLKHLSAININPIAIEFGGIPKYALQVQVSDLGCQSCSSAALDALTPLAVSASYYFTTAKSGDIQTAKLTTFNWIDKRITKADLDTAKNTIKVSVKQHAVARLDEMIRALSRAGLVPLSVRIEAGQA